MTKLTNKKCFEDFALKSMDSIYTSALRLTKNAQEAEILVQSTYLRAFEVFDTIGKQRICCRWFLSILKNEFKASFGYYPALQTLQ